jgi:hypothetical protein
LPTDTVEVARAGAAAAPADQGLTATEALALDLAPGPRRGSHKLARARKKQRSASAAVGAADDNPALGALNRHLNMLMHQLATAHRVIGRIAAERDALRQQLADLQGIPVEEITVTTIGASSFEDPAAKPGARRQPASAPSTTNAFVAKLNYFNVEDVAVARKRRQVLVLVLLTVIVVLWVSARIGWWAMPANMSRESLGNLPYIGDLVTVFLAGWIFYRIVRVSSRGVRWIFPSEDQRRRRR